MTPLETILNRIKQYKANGMTVLSVDYLIEMINKHKRKMEESA